MSKRLSLNQPGSKKKRRSGQASLLKFFSKTRSTNSQPCDYTPKSDRASVNADMQDLDSCSVSDTCQSQRDILGSQACSSSKTLSTVTVPVTPQDFGIHMFTLPQIQNSAGMLKEYRLFWNEKARDLCSDVTVTKEKLKDKVEIQGAINVAWTMHKSSLLQMQADEIQEEAKTIYDDPVGRAHLLMPIERNLTKVLESHAYIQQLHDHSDLPVDKLQDDIDSEIHELKKAQDALNKALESRRQDMDQAKRRVAEKHTVQSPVKLSEAEVEDLVNTIKAEYQVSDYDALTDSPVGDIEDC